MVILLYIKWFLIRNVIINVICLFNHYFLSIPLKFAVQFAYEHQKEFPIQALSPFVCFTYHRDVNRQLTAFRILFQQYRFAFEIVEFVHFCVHCNLFSAEKTIVCRSRTMHLMNLNCKFCYYITWTFVLYWFSWKDKLNCTLT